MNCKFMKVPDKKFKAMVALEAVRGEKTLAQLPSEYGVHANVIANWKKRLMKALPDVFAKNSEKNKQDMNKDKDALYKEIGKLKMSLSIKSVEAFLHGKNVHDELFG